jgi:hypothetical protein
VYNGITEITAGVKAMAEGEQGVEVLVYVQMGLFWEWSCLFWEAYDGCSGRIVRGSMETKAKSYSHNMKVYAHTLQLQVDALISQVADLRSELLRALLCLDLPLYQSKQITILNIYIIFST